MKSIRSHSADETIRLGKAFAATLRPGDVVVLSGELGAGKTKFIAGICDALGVHTHVGSPTFTLINEYPARLCTVVHIDLYRITTQRELVDLGVEEYFDDQHICLIEWGERMAELLPQSHIAVRLAHGNEDTERVITIEGAGRSVERAGGIPA
jgi:tRNA threonylcarbamoyladenosine biosynthesis protein TsaE